MAQMNAMDALPLLSGLNDFIHAGAWPWTGHDTMFQAVISTELFKEYKALTYHSPLLSFQAFLQSVAERDRVYGGEVTHMCTHVFSALPIVFMIVLLLLSRIVIPCRSALFAFLLFCRCPVHVPGQGH